MFRLSLFVLAASLGLTMFLVPGVAPLPANGVVGEASLASASTNPSPDEDKNELSPSYGGATEIRRDGSGQFYLDGKVDDTSVRFLVDTGADMVTLTVDDARRAGLYVDENSFSVVGRGASGETWGKHYRVSRLTVAGRTLTGVDVIVLEGLGVNLLGQSVLRQFDKVELNGDKLTLR